MNCGLLVAIFSVLSAFYWYAAYSQTCSKKPNSVFIVADDLGYMNLSLTGNKYYDTPNIYRLAKRRRIFTKAYIAGRLRSTEKVSDRQLFFY